MTNLHYPILHSDYIISQADSLRRSIRGVAYPHLLALSIVIFAVRGTSAADMGVGASIRCELGLGDEPDFLKKKNRAKTKATKHGDPPDAVQVVMEVNENAVPNKLWRQEGTSLTQLQEGIFRHLSGTAYRTYKVTRACLDLFDRFVRTGL